MAIQAYIDDSGVKGTDPIFVLAGFIGKAEQWAEFSTAWKQHLRESPSIAYFKMAEAAKLGGEFRFWKHADRDRKLRGCVEVIKRYPPQHAIHCTIDLDAFKKRESRSYEKPGPVSHPYLLGSHVVLSGVCYEVLDSGSQDQIEVIFDQQLIFAPRLKLWYPMIREGLSHVKDETLRSLSRVLPADPMFRDDKHLLPLQAADMLAWLFRMAFSGHRTEFEWIGIELASVMPMSRYSTILTEERMDRQEAMSHEVQFPPELVRKWVNNLGLPRWKRRKRNAKKPH
ncbi:MAG: DUF3800 domain-containing protein [Terriglobia bacterium]